MKKSLKQKPSFRDGQNISASVSFVHFEMSVFVLVFFSHSLNVNVCVRACVWIEASGCTACTHVWHRLTFMFSQ